MDIRSGKGELRLARAGARLGAFLVLIAAMGCASSPSHVDAPDPVLVYRAVLDTIRADMRETSRLALAPSSRAISPESALFSHIPVEQGLAAAFAAANRTDATFGQEDAARLGVPLFDPTRSPPTALPSDPDIQWQDVVRSYGGDGLRIVRLSRVGFSLDGRSAAVYYGWTCGGLCGQTRLAVLERDGDRWRIVAERIMLVS